METNNETVAEIVSEARRELEIHGDMHDWKLCLGKLLPRIEAAYKREIAAKDEEIAKQIAQLNKSVELWMEYHDTMKCERDAFLDELKKKYAEIERLKDENANLRVINCGSIYAEGNLREEIERLRALVKGLLDASSISCADCKYDCYSDHSNCIIHEAAKYLEESEVENG